MHFKYTSTVDRAGVELEIKCTADYKDSAGRIAWRILRQVSKSTLPADYWNSKVPGLYEMNQMIVFNDSIDIRIKVKVYANDLETAMFRSRCAATKMIFAKSIDRLLSTPCPQGATIYRTEDFRKNVEASE